MMDKSEYLKLFQRKEDPDYPYEEKFADFKKELLKVSNRLGLGENISVESFYDGPSLEKIFIIHLDYKLDYEDEYNYFEQIIDHMDEFCRKNNLHDFFLDASVLIKCDV